MTALKIIAIAFGCACHLAVAAQGDSRVTVTQVPGASRVDISIAGRSFTSLLYPDSLEKPVLYPVRTVRGTVVTRGFPLDPIPGEPTDHPHHLGIWLNYENVNGLDFWNNSFAIPPDKKSSYGWIRTDRITAVHSGKTGSVSYHANWTNQQRKVLLQENTRLEFSASGPRRIIDRFTTLTADTVVTFADAKDGMLGMRVAKELQIPSAADQKFKDNKGNETVVKSNDHSAASGNYLTSEGAAGDAAWSTRGRWCKLYGAMNGDSVSIIIIDHPGNPNYPTFWHARGYGLFAANPLGEKVFTNGKTAFNLHLQPGESVTFRYRIVIAEGTTTPGTIEINRLANRFSGKK